MEWPNGGGRSNDDCSAIAATGTITEATHPDADAAGEDAAGTAGIATTATPPGPTLAAATSSAKSNPAPHPAAATSDTASTAPAAHCKGKRTDGPQQSAKGGSQQAGDI